MLSLVSYGSSGESDDEENSDNGSTSSDVKTTTSSTKNVEKEVGKFNDEEWDEKDIKKANEKPVGELQPFNDSTIGILDSKENPNLEDNLFSKLPPPVTDLRSIPWDQLSKLTYKSRAIRIMAPSIPEDVEEKKEKKLPSKTGSGLLAMLPKPRNQFLATPSTLKHTSITRKQTQPTHVKPKTLPKPKLTSIKKSEDHESDSDEEVDDKIDFFSLTAAPDVPEIKFGVNDMDMPLTSDIPLPSQQSFEKSQLSEIPLPSNQSRDIPQSSSQVAKSSFRIDTTGDTSQRDKLSSYSYVPFQQPNDELQLDSEALAALCGSRGLKRRGGNDDEFKIIDINGSQLTPDAQELLTKNLTSDQPRPKRNNKDGPTSQQKRKHQIIYLAHQAKEQELELQNTWSNNRMSKKQTQAKYGF